MSVFLAAVLASSALYWNAPENAATRYDEGYGRGVHDTDAAIIDDHYFGEAQTLIALLRFMAPSFQELSLVGCRSEPLSQ